MHRLKVVLIGHRLHVWHL